MRQIAIRALVLGALVGMSGCGSTDVASDVATDIAAGLVAEIAAAPGDVVLERGIDRTSAVASEAPVDPKNVVLLIGDGMGAAHVLGARAISSGMAQPLQMERLAFSGMQTTYSLRELLTDSASAASSLATGEKVVQTAISMDEQGTRLETFAERAIRSGRSLGLVTDSYLWDATPAAFLTHASSRDDHQSIVDQLAASGAKVLIGTTADPARKTTHPEPDVVRAFENSGWAIVHDWEQLQRSSKNERPVVALFPFGSLAAANAQPTLSDATEIALRRLARNPEGFFLMIETEETDIASHANDFERAARGVLSLDDALKTVLRFTAVNRDTLIVVTADHESGGLTLLSGVEGAPLSVQWATTSHTAAMVPIYATGPGAGRFTGTLDNTEIAGVLSDMLGVPRSSREAVGQP